MWGVFSGMIVIKIEVEGQKIKQQNFDYMCALRPIALFFSAKKMELIHTPPPTNNGEKKSNATDPKQTFQNPNNGENNDTHESQSFFEDFDSACSTPYVSAPSSPGRGGGHVSGFFYSCPASPMHFVLASSNSVSSSCFNSAMDDSDTSSVPMGYEFEFSARFGSTGSVQTGSMSSADELFLNGQIRPMKLSTHLEKPQVLAPLLDLENENEQKEEDDEISLEPIRGRDLRSKNKSLRRRTRSMSPMRNSQFDWSEEEEKKISTPNPNGSCNKNKNGEDDEEEEEETLSSETTTASSSRSSSAGRNSKRWLFLKEFLRSKSEGRSNNKFWSTISFSPIKEKKPINNPITPSSSKDQIKNSETQKAKKTSTHQSVKKTVIGKPTNGVGKRRVPPSPHELHYTTKRAQAEEMRKKTYLPYRQGLLGCLGFSSKGYGAMNGLARALNPVSSR
ncbi:hypothetical protein CsatB_030504 [Cannabis sativa]